MFQIIRKPRIYYVPEGIRPEVQNDSLKGRTQFNSQPNGLSLREWKTVILDFVLFSLGKITEGIKRNLTSFLLDLCMQSKVTWSPQPYMLVIVTLS